MKTCAFCSALLEDDGNQRVFVVQGGKAVSRPVTLGLTNGPLVEVLSGVNEGDPVVVVGQGTLKDGSPVRVVASAPPAATAPKVATANPGSSSAPAPAAR